MVVLYHFDRPYFHARHYLGPFIDHPLVQAAKRAGVQITLVRTWNDSELPRLKRGKRSDKHCSQCRLAKYRGEQGPQGAGSRREG